MPTQVLRMSDGHGSPMGGDDGSQLRKQLSYFSIATPQSTREVPSDSRAIEGQPPVERREVANSGFSNNLDANSVPLPVEEQTSINTTGFRSNNAAHDGLSNGAQQPPDMRHTAATPPAAPSTPQGGSGTSTPHKSRPTSSIEPGIKRSLTNFFRRSNSHHPNGSGSNLTMTQNDGPTSAPPAVGRGNSETILGQRKKSTGPVFDSDSTTTSRSNTPRSNSPPSQVDEPPLGKKATMLEPNPAQFFGKNKTRATSNLSNHFRDRFITFTSGSKSPPKPPRHRASSMDLETAATQASKSKNSSTDDGSVELTRNEWAIPADAGTGLKSRRMSVSLPDDFWVDVVPLHEEFSDQSKMLGKRGKTLGKTNTAKVTLMVRKGFPNELYAVKEYRGKSANETAAEYEKKVKSEYSIAKSLHHPNIVETIRLCTSNGRFNHVMEYCSEGDLFGLIKQGYLKKPDRLPDRLCLFKQLVQGVHYLHSHGIAHRDIKVENLLITNNSKLKITDFGVSDVFSGIHPGLRQAGGQCGIDMKDVRLSAPGICGSIPYIAPEVFEKKSQYDPRCLDVWSSAVVMIYIVFGGCIWNSAEQGKPDNKHYDSLIRGWAKWEAKHEEGDKMTDVDYPHVEAFDKMVNPPALRKMLLGMLHPDPAKRFSIDTVAGNRWLRNVECCQLDSYDDPQGSQVIDASKQNACFKLNKVVQHNHLPPSHHVGHRLVRLPGSTDM